jgi:dTDP-4-amino-4,6-dideoxygalactose transaminase
MSSPIVGRAEIRAVKRVLKSGNLAQGKKVTQFENEFSKLVGDRPSVAVNSGTSALHLALISLGLGSGDEVIVPSFTFAASANSICLTGATPIFVDVDPRTFNIDPDSVLRAITPRTKAIMVVHLYGNPADMKQIRKIADDHALMIVEDAAQAHLASIDGAPVGTFGDAAIFSFYPTKNMTTGEGGMIILKDASAERTCRLLRNQGMLQRYQNEIVGFNLRMTEIAAAIGLEQIKRLEDWTEKRIEIAGLYSEKIENFIVPMVKKGHRHVFHQYTIKVLNERDKVSDFLTTNGVSNAVYYPTPVHELKAFGLTIELPITKSISKQVLSLPMHPKLNTSEIKRVISAVNRASHG